MDHSLVTPDPDNSGDLYQTGQPLSHKALVIEPSAGFQAPFSETGTSSSLNDIDNNSFIAPAAVAEQPMDPPEHSSLNLPPTDLFARAVPAAQNLVDTPQVVHTIEPQAEPSSVSQPEVAPAFKVSQPEMPGSLSNLATAAVVTPADPIAEPSPGPQPFNGMVLPGPEQPSSADPLQPATQPAGQVFQSFNSAKPTKTGKKRWLLPAIAAVSILLVGGGYVFGIFLPNQPQNVYKTGFSRTGKALSIVVDKSTNQTAIDSYKKTQLTLKVDANYGGAKYNAAFDAKFDASKTNAGINVTSAGTGGNDIKFNAKAISEIPADSDFPNIYFQLNGLKSLGVEEFYPQLLAYDGKWIEVSASYLKSLGDFPSASKTNSKTLTAGDYTELAHAFTTSTNSYVFTNDQSKAVFVQKSYEGKETSDGLNVYHYKVTINQDHAVAYCKDAVDKVYSTNAYKKLPWVDEKNISQDKAQAQKDCDSYKHLPSGDVPNGKEKVYDMWIDAKYKLIYKFRIPDDIDNSSYTDVGQIYKGGDTFTLFANNHNGQSKTDTNVKLVSDTKSATTTGSISYTNSDTKDKVNVTLEAKPYSGVIDTNKPKDSVPIQTVLKQIGLDPSELGLGGSSGTGGNDSSSVGPTPQNRDAERKFDINSIAVQLEVYYNDNGGYPLLSSQVNTDSWISANMNGAEPQQFRAPGQTANSMVQSAKPDKNHFGYIPLQADGTTICKNEPCAKYRLYWFSEVSNSVTAKDSLN